MTPPKNDDRVQLGGPTGKYAVVFSLILIVLPLCGAIGVGFHFGVQGGHKGDEAIRDVLVAIALLAQAVLFAVWFGFWFLRSIARAVEETTVQLKKLESASQKANDQPGVDDPPV